MKKILLKNRANKFLLVVLAINSIFFAGDLFAQNAIGHKQITFQDPSRANRNIQTEIYYPATVAGDNVAMAAGEYPVIVFGHGFVMAWDAYQNLWQQFVPRGYIMLFPRTEGNIFGTNHQEFGWDLKFLVTRMQSENNISSSIFYNHVAQETALMGHSMGGGAAFLAADSLCQNGNINLKTIIGLAPAESSTNGVSSIKSAKSITVPAVIMSGSQDGVTPPIQHHIPMYDSLASDCKTFINILGGAHCYFANTNTNCDFGEGTSSSGISITRANQHAVTFDFINLWLDYTLKGDCIAFDVFNDSLNSSIRISNNQECVMNPVPGIYQNGNDLFSNQTGLSYQWFLEGNPISNSNSISITFTQNGNYTVAVFYANGCSELSIPFSVTSVGISENGLDNFSVYPNPSKGLIAIKGTSLSGKQVTIFNASGQNMQDFSIENDFTLNLSNLNNGIYVLKINEFTQRILLIK
ncbi:MAG: T9SS type A sorting domain-containing protein [Bacteroidetes bacterium]|nr:T9SS type A sorting domain-containing protein [Bacteroidota bacterium]HET6246048.1 T9SS type A sorting domain-containing protein [Bacteroidia bacterium]